MPKSIYKRHICDQCGETFKRGRRMDLIVSKVTIKEGEMQWSLAEDIEYIAYFCSPGCLMGYVMDKYYHDTEGESYEELQYVHGGRRGDENSNINPL